MRSLPLLLDGHGREHRDLRISLTDHCNLRCTYCMPAQGVPWLPKPTLLTRAELFVLAGCAVRAGVTELRLTGGEPLLRTDIVAVVAGLAALEGPAGRPEVSMTTNGIGLERLAADLAGAGLARVNISLDTLRRDRFAQLARRDRLDDTLAGIEAARAAGLGPLKLNAVLLREVNTDEAVDLLGFALARDAEIRFIEQMPLDAGHTWTREGMVTAEETQALLEAVYHLTPLPGRGAAPAERYAVRPHGRPDADPLGTVGIIASVTRPFCGTCDRLRLTADGQFRTCLFATTETDLRTPLRAGASEEELAGLIRAGLAAKLPGHGINDPGFLQPPRPMSAIGG
ncbi:GTP 3',8-cyclase MoaA [Propioniciclava soli]|uniref:GTP 3',8-cyclase n=1 Tax=Propioniciclava soli TaxID=2775081 RepID=A0ABZ3C9G6_9ACTN